MTIRIPTYPLNRLCITVVMAPVLSGLSACVIPPPAQRYSATVRRAYRLAPNE